MTLAVALSPSFKDYALNITSLTLKAVNTLYTSALALKVVKQTSPITFPIIGLLSIWALGGIYTNHLLNKMVSTDIDLPIAAATKIEDKSLAESILNKKRSSCLLSCIKAPSCCIDLLPIMIIKGVQFLSVIIIGLLITLPYYVFFPSQPNNLIVYGIETTLKFYPFIMGSYVFGRLIFNTINHIPR